MQFIYRNFCYSVIDSTKLIVSVGNTSNPSSPNAIYSSYASSIVISQFVYQENKKYEVVEIAENAFRGCNITKHIVIPSSIIAIRKGCFDSMFSVETFVIKGGSRLETIEIFALSRLYGLKTLVLPYTVSSIADESLACLINLIDLYICGSVEVTNDVFRDYIEADKTNPSLRIHVPRTYKGIRFGNRTNLANDDYSSMCVFSSEHSCKPKSNRMNSIALSMIAVILASI